LHRAVAGVVTPARAGLDYFNPEKKYRVAAKGGTETAWARVEHFMLSIRGATAARVMLNLLTEHFNVPPVQLNWAVGKAEGDDRRRLACYSAALRIIEIYPDHIDQDHQSRRVSHSTPTIDSALCHEFAHHLATISFGLTPRHDAAFWWALDQVVAFWYDNVRNYPWVAESETVYLLACLF
jgi:hypothetical protein